MARSSYVNPNIPLHLHEKIKRMAREKGKTIISEYESALEAWIAQETQNILLADSKLETMLMDKLNKMEKRLADLNARVGMDVSIILMAVLHDLSQEYHLTEQELYEQFRPAAAKYFSRPMRTQQSG